MEINPSTVFYPAADRNDAGVILAAELSANGCAKRLVAHFDEMVKTGLAEVLIGDDDDEPIVIRLIEGASYITDDVKEPSVIKESVWLWVSKDGSPGDSARNDPSDALTAIDKKWPRGRWRKSTGAVARLSLSVCSIRI